MTCLCAIFYVSLPACDLFSYCLRFVFGLYDGLAEVSMTLLFLLSRGSLPISLDLGI